MKGTHQNVSQQSCEHSVGVTEGPIQGHSVPQFRSSSEIFVFSVVDRPELFHLAGGGMPWKSRRQ